MNKNFLRSYVLIQIENSNDKEYSLTRMFQTNKRRLAQPLSWESYVWEYSFK